MKQSWSFVKRFLLYILIIGGIEVDIWKGKHTRREHGQGRLGEESHFVFVQDFGGL